jgi:ABC-type polysaccharide/polyol phosphate transport system ATPase subunit
MAPFSRVDEDLSVSDVLVEAKNLSLSRHSHWIKPSLFESMLGKYRAPGVKVLEDVSFTFKGGERIGILGPNGVGKTSLLKCLAGVLNPSEGVLQRQGSVFPLLDLSACLVSHFDGVTNLYYLGTLLNVPKRKIEEALPSIISSSGLGKKVYQPISTYSSGMILRLMFSFFPVVEADILLIDEILSVGDEEFRLRAQKIIDDLLIRSKLFVCVTHDLDYLKKNTERCLWLNKGKLQMDGPTDEVIKNYLHECHGN